jgi:hypothetical protein
MHFPVIWEALSIRSISSGSLFRRNFQSKGDRRLRVFIGNISLILRAKRCSLVIIWGKNLGYSFDREIYWEIALRGLSE